MSTGRCIARIAARWMKGYPLRMPAFRYLFAVDPSLTCSGWVLFRVADGEIASVGKIKSAPASVPLAERLRAIQDSISTIFAKIGLGENDLLVCEAATTMKDPHNALKVEQVRTIFESVARARLVRVPGRINPRSVQQEVMGLSGKQVPRAEVKSTAVKTAEFLYSSALRRLGLADGGEPLSKHQDIVDAMLVGRLALIRIQAARDGALSIESMFQSLDRGRGRSWRVKACGL